MPQKSEPRNCKVIASDLEFMKCVAENYMNLEGDYKKMEAAFKGCK